VENPVMDKRLDPTTGDYDGTAINDLGNAVFLRITTPLGSWWADPAMGSKLYLLARAKDLQRNQALAEAYTREALQPLIDSQRATAIDVASDWPHDGTLRLRTTITQAGGVTQTFTNYVRVS
jgi:phage gp46-like protein